MHMTLRTEIEIGCTLPSCSMYVVYYYSDWLYVIEMLTYFNDSHDIKKCVESRLSGMIESSHDNKPLYYFHFTILVFAEKSRAGTNENII